MTTYISRAANARCHQYKGEQSRVDIGSALWSASAAPRLCRRCSHFSPRSVARALVHTGSWQAKAILGPACGGRQRWQLGGQHTGAHRQPVQAASLGGPLAELAAGFSGDALQDILVGGAIVSAVGAALLNGTKGEPEMCEGCAGMGGVTCFGCEGSGRMKSESRDQMSRARKRDIVGRSENNYNCKVCKGPGLILCSRCQGTGYQKRM